LEKSIVQIQIPRIIMYLLVSNNTVQKARFSAEVSDQVDELDDIDSLNYQIAYKAIKDNHGTSRKTNKKIGPTPEKDATNLKFKKKRRQEEIKSRKATKIYLEYTRFKP
jgi:hypothetical protein